LHPGGFIVFRPMVLGVIEFSINFFVLGNSLKTKLVNFEGKLNFKQVKCILYFIYYMLQYVHNGTDSTINNISDSTINNNIFETAKNLQESVRNLDTHVQLLLNFFS